MEEKLKVLCSLVCGATLQIFNGGCKELAVLVILILVDTIFGWVKSFKKGNWKSLTARVGFMGKIVEVMLVLCLFIIDWVLNVNYIKYIGLYYFMICEIASIIENYAQINGNLPEGLSELLNKLRTSFSSRIIKEITKFINKVEDGEEKDEH